MRSPHRLAEPAGKRPMTSQPDGARHRGSSVPLLGLLMALALIAAASGSTGEDRQSTADEPGTTVTTEPKTVEEPTTGEAETGDGPVTDEIRVAVLVDGEFVGSDGISETTRFRIGSVTKMFTAVVLSQLHADGLIDLDVPISKPSPVRTPPRSSPSESTSPSASPAPAGQAMTPTARPMSPA